MSRKRSRRISSERGTASTARSPSNMRRRRDSTTPLFVKLEGAIDAAGQPLKVESSREGHYLKWKIYVDDANDAVRTIVLHYRVSNGLKFFEDHDELYWNVTGDEWDVPVENASAQILLPPGVTGIRALAFTGAYGSRAQNADVGDVGQHRERVHAAAARVSRRADRRGVAGIRAS